MQRSRRDITLLPTFLLDTARTGAYTAVHRTHALTALASGKAARLDGGFPGTGTGSASTPVPAARVVWRVVWQGFSGLKETV